MSGYGNGVGYSELSILSKKTGTVTASGLKTKLENQKDSWSNLDFKFRSKLVSY